MSKKKILLVDDDPVVLKALSIKLTAEGYDAVTAKDGSAAVNAVRTLRPDLIILDITFPPDFGNVDWDGFRIMEWLKRLDEVADTPIFVVTGGDPARFETRAKELGAAGFFRKPVNHEQLLAAIRTVLGQQTVSA